MKSIYNGSFQGWHYILSQFSYSQRREFIESKIQTKEIYTLEKSSLLEKVIETYNMEEYEQNDYPRDSFEMAYQGLSGEGICEFMLASKNYKGFEIA